MLNEVCLAIDYGRKRIGLAVGRLIPRGIGIIDGSQKLEKIIRQIKTICRENEAEKIIIGLPIRSQGEEGALTAEIRAFGQAVEKATGLPVILEPEQFTSTEAERYLKEQGAKFNKEKIDELAAILILEQYLQNKA